MKHICLPKHRELPLTNHPYSWRMPHVKQIKAWGDCGVAAMAMAANVPYETALHSVPPDVYEHGLWYQEIEHALFKLTQSYWSTANYIVSKPLAQSFLPPEDVVLGITKPEYNNIFHYVAFDGAAKLLHDPMEEGPIPEANLGQQLNWHVAAMFRRA